MTIVVIILIIIIIYIYVELQFLRHDKLKKIDEEINTKRQLAELELEKFLSEKEEILGAAYNNLESQLDYEYNQNLEEYEFLKTELQNFRAQHRAINEENRKSLLIDNNRQAYSIVISNNAKLDIDFLLSIENRLSNTEVIRKLIWSEYLSKSFSSMIKLQFGGDIPRNVIYCIENSETHQKYIGKTVGSVADRWTAHIKSSLNIGTISHQIIHESLLNNWDKFIFSIIEIIPETANINEKEKFYINMYETDKYGYNITSGG